MEQNEYRYYSTRRPIDIGTYPKPAGNPLIELVNYDVRLPVEGGPYMAWGHLVYQKPLSEAEISDYELRPSRFNLDVQEIMNAQASIIGPWEERNELPADQRLTVWSVKACDFIAAAQVSQEQLAERYSVAKKFPYLSSKQMKVFSKPQHRETKTKGHER